MVPSAVDDFPARRPVCFDQPILSAAVDGLLHDRVDVRSTGGESPVVAQVEAEHSGHHRIARGGHPHHFHDELLEQAKFVEFVAQHHTTSALPGFECPWLAQGSFCFATPHPPTSSKCPWLVRDRSASRYTNPPRQPECPWLVQDRSVSATSHPPRQLPNAPGLSRDHSASRYTTSAPPLNAPGLSRDVPFLATPHPPRQL